MQSIELGNGTEHHMQHPPGTEPGTLAFVEQRFMFSASLFPSVPFRFQMVFNDTQRPASNAVSHE
jgi:hypothetical protein